MHVGGRHTTTLTSLPLLMFHLDHSQVQHADHSFSLPSAYHSLPLCFPPPVSSTPPHIDICMTTGRHPPFRSNLDLIPLARHPFQRPLNVIGHHRSRETHSPRSLLYMLRIPNGLYMLVNRQSACTKRASLLLGPILPCPLEPHCLCFKGPV